MALTKEVVTDQITITENGTILVREVTRIMEDGVLIGESFHRTSHMPGADVTKESPKVAAIAAAAWTPDVVGAFETKTQALAADAAK